LKPSHIFAGRKVVLTKIYDPSWRIYEGGFVNPPLTFGFHQKGGPIMRYPVKLLGLLEQFAQDGVELGGIDGNPQFTKAVPG
jgi:hypothetical protein